MHPQIPGLTYVGDLGSGGYADVYAYDQRFPARRVAVKVLRDASDATASALVAEANALARLEHPHIVAIYGGGRTDEGRPYLVSQLCPLPTFAVRASQRLEVPEVLRVGVQLAGAVETAHRAGLLHRDIKPANVLTTRYGLPALADFGTAGAAHEPELGISLPWTAPEVLAGGPHAAASDVYALAATLWTLLTRRAPHQRPGDTAARMVRRARSEPAPPTGRPDVPQVLEDALGRALAPRGVRTPSALALAQELGAVESALGLPRTPPVLPVEGAARPHATPVLASALLRDAMGDGGRR